MISIVIPVYNQAEKLKKCLKSIACQNYNDYEVIVVNDGSTDAIYKTAEQCKRFFPSGKFYFLSQENKGANAARNFGAQKAHGDFFLFADADVFMEKDMLEKMMGALIGNANVAYAYSSFYWGIKKFVCGEWSAERLKKEPYIHTTSLLRREYFMPLDLKIKKFQDWDLWLSVLERGGRGIWIDEYLYKISTGGTMSHWLPSFAYKIFPFLSQVKKYHAAVGAIKEKHNL